VILVSSSQAVGGTQEGGSQLFCGCGISCRWALDRFIQRSEFLDGLNAVCGLNLFEEIVAFLVEAQKD